MTQVTLKDGDPITVRYPTPDGADRYRAVVVVRNGKAHVRLLLQPDHGQSSPRLVRVTLKKTKRKKK